MLPEIEYRARHAFHGVTPGRLEELVGEVIGCAFHVYVFLAQRGKADIAYAKPLAISAIKQVCTARRGSVKRQLQANCAKRRRGISA
jgi:hypothetical protein